MPTIFELLDGLNTGDLTTTVDGQVGQLNTVITLVTNLAENPPDDIGDLVSTLQEIGLPDIDLGDDLPTTLQSLTSALPSDLSSVTGPLTEGLSRLGETVGTDLVAAIQQGLGPILALARLFQLDFTCEHENGERAERPRAAVRAPGEPNGITTTLDQATGVLAAIPSPLTVDSLLTLLAGVLDLPLDGMLPVPIPYLDDIREPLQTVVAWKGMPPDEIAASMAGTVGKLADLARDCTAAAVDPLAAELGRLPQQAHTAELATIADGLIQALDALKAAVQAGDLTTAPATAAVTHASGLLDQLDAIRSDRAPNPFTPLLDRIRTLPAEIDDRVSSLENLLSAPSPFPNLALAAADATGPIDAAVTQAIDQAIGPTLDWLQQLVGKLDLSAIEEPIAQVATTVHGAVDQLEEGLATVTTEVQALFSQVDDLLDGVDIEALVDTVKTALADFSRQLTQRLDDLFAPVQQVVGRLVQQIDQAVTGFDPTTIVDGLKGVVQSLTDVLSGPEVTGAINQIKGALDSVGEQLKGLSFAPVTDQVVGAIDQVTQLLQALDPATLSPPLQLALNGAVALLPGDLTPLTDPLVDEFGQLVDEGPAQLIGAAQAPVAQLLDRVRHFEPAGLIGDTLGAPFRSLIDTLEGFTPSTLLKEIDKELAGLKDRLKEAADPAQLVAPLQQGFDGLLQEFDRLKPSELVKPINDALQQVVQTALDAVPIDDLLAPVNDVLARIQEISDVGTKAVGLLDKVQEVLTAAGELPGQVEDWVDGIATTVGGLANTSALRAAVADVVRAVDDMKAAAITDRIDSILDPVLSAINDLDAQRRLTDLVQAYRGVSTRRLNGLPDSPAKQAIKDLLQRANPTKPPFSEPFDHLAAFQEGLQAARAALAAAFRDWDDRHALADGALAGLAAVDVTAANLRTWIGDTLKANVVPPVRAVLNAAGPIAAFVDPLQTHLNALVTEVTDKLSVLLAGEGSVGAITGAIDQLLDLLRNVDLSFLTDALDEIFAGVREKFTALSPAELATPIGEAFDEALGALSIGSVLPAADVQKLDDDFRLVIEKLAALDPATLVTDVVQPEFEEKVLPILDVFDVSALLQTLLDVLHGLQDDLRTDLGEVNDAYKAMLAAVPPFDPLALAGDLGDVAGAVGDLF